MVERPSGNALDKWQDEGRMMFRTNVRFSPGLSSGVAKIVSVKAAGSFLERAHRPSPAAKRQRQWQPI